MIDFRLQTAFEPNVDESVRHLLSQVLFGPVQDIFQRPGKMIRGQMVKAGLLLSDRTQPMTAAEFNQCERQCLAIAEALEAVHAGSLIVDDIQDGSKVRRGSPALHEVYGIPLALNAGNWLYFWPMQKIRELDLVPDKELALYRMYHETLLHAHAGQALDIGTRIDLLPRDQVAAVCHASMEMKTGALMALALCSGAIIGGASRDRIDFLHDFGTRFGIALQMFDDIGNLNLSQNDPKRLEDLRLRRPTWLWAAAAGQSSESEYQAFRAAVNELPLEPALNSWLFTNDFVSRARSTAHTYLDESLAAVSAGTSYDSRSTEALFTLKQLAHKIEVSYG